MRPLVLFAFVWPLCHACAALSVWLGTQALNFGVGLPAGNTWAVLVPSDLGAWSSISLTWTGLQVQRVIIILHPAMSVGLQGTDNLCSWAWPGGTAGITGIFAQEGKREKQEVLEQKRNCCSNDHINNRDKTERREGCSSFKEAVDFHGSLHVISTKQLAK